MLELEFIEEYELLGEKRFRFRVKGTNIVINVAASNKEEAVNKAKQLIIDMGVEEFIRMLKTAKSA